MRRNVLVLTVVLLILAAFAWAGWANWEYRKQAAEKLLASAGKGELVPSAAGDAVEYRSPLVGKAAPAFTLEDMQGKKISLESYRGKAVLVNFWATWCGPCKIETPWLIELRNKYASQGFEILGVDTEGEDLKKSDLAGWAKDKTEVNKFVEQEKDALSDAAGRRQHQRTLRRTRRAADFVLCGSERQRCGGADGLDLGE